MISVGLLQFECNRLSITLSYVEKRFLTFSQVSNQTKISIQLDEHSSSWPIEIWCVCSKSNKPASWWLDWDWIGLRDLYSIKKKQFYWSQGHDIHIMLWCFFLIMVTSCRECRVPPVLDGFKQVDKKYSSFPKQETQSVENNWKNASN